MQLEEKILIKELFKKLKEVEQKNYELRDIEAEHEIKHFVCKQPESIYYMVQSLLIQEAALKKFSQEIKYLKNKITQLELNQQQSNKGFFSRFFGKKAANTVNKSQVPISNAKVDTTVPTSTSITPNPSFISGALQTAAGVAGGMVLGNMITDMFRHSSSSDIINSINHSTLADEKIDSNQLLDLDQDKDLSASNLEVFDDVSNPQLFERDHDSLLDDNFANDYVDNDNDNFF